MKFKSDSQRKAIFSKLNNLTYIKFSNDPKYRVSDSSARFLLLNALEKENIDPNSIPKNILDVFVEGIHDDYETENGNINLGEDAHSHVMQILNLWDNVKHGATDHLTNRKLIDKFEGLEIKPLIAKDYDYVTESEYNAIEKPSSNIVYNPLEIDEIERKAINDAVSKDTLSRLVRYHYDNSKKKEDDFSRASDMVNKMKGFVSTRDAPAPNFITNDDNYDLAAVVAGTKPAAIVSVDNQNDTQKELLDKAIKKGMIIGIMKSNLGDDFVVGNEINVKKLLELKNSIKLDDDMINKDEFHIENGEALGYNAEAISDFIKTIKTNRYYADDLKKYNKMKGNMIE